MFSVLTRKFDLTWKDCIEKARTYLVRESQRDDPRPIVFICLSPSYLGLMLL
jgi:hypothetical protein